MWNHLVKRTVIVVSPLVNMMKDQVSRLTSLGMSAVSFSDICSDEEMRSVEKGSYSIVYGSPESWLGLVFDKQLCMLAL